MVRAKFTVQRIEDHYHPKAVHQPDGSYATAYRDLVTIVLTPVYSPDPAHENRPFWEASPSGEVRPGTVNPEAAKYFELGQAYYLDFTHAEQA